MQRTKSKKEIPNHHIPLRVLSMIIIISCIGYLGFAQTKQNIVIQGTIENSHGQSIKVSRSTLFKQNVLDSITVNTDGSFHYKIETEAKENFAFLIGRNPFIIYINPGDKIHLRFNKEKQLTITGQNEQRSTQLNYQARNLLRRSQRIDSTARAIGKSNISDSLKYVGFSEACRHELDLLSKDSLILGNEFGQLKIETYYTFLDQLSNFGLFNVEYFLPGKVHIGMLNKDLIYLTPHTQSKYVLIESPTYRSYIFDLYRRDISPAKPSNVDIYPVKQSPAWSDFNQLNRVMDNFVREWLLARSVRFSIERYASRDAEDVMNLYMKTAKYNNFKSQVYGYWLNAIKFKPGNTAPDFILTNETGKAVKLSDFKGKIVYIDFWGIHCAPCVEEIKKYTASFHKKYDLQKVVFINICMDETKNAWLSSLKVLRPHGINLFGSFNGIGKTYIISTIPHYLLIDKDGKISEYNAERPSEMILNPTNSIDRLIKK